MSMYQAPTTCALVTPTKPGTAGNWQMQDQGNGFLIAAHDGETRDTCYKKKNAGPPPTPPPAGSYDQIGTVHTNVHYRPYHTARPTHYYYRHRDAAGATRAQQSHRLSNSVMLHPQEMASASLRPRHACRTGCAMTQVCSRIRVRRRKPPVLRCARKTQTAQASCKTAPN